MMMMKKTKPPHGIPRKPGPPGKVRKAFNLITLIIGFGLLIIAQFVLLPFVFTFFIHDPYNTHGISGSGSGSNPNDETTMFFSDGGTSRRERRKRKRLSSSNNNGGGKPPDATFNGVPVYLRTKSAKDMQSYAHCVGENYRDDAWKYRSCRFHMMCLNITTNQFQLFHTDHERLLSVYMAQRVHMHSSTTLLRYTAQNPQFVSIGGINQKWNDDGIQRMKWFPKIVHLNKSDETAADVVSYYELPPESVLVPFHSFNGANPGHLVWDDFLPIYTLLQMFQLVNNNDNDDNNDRELLLLRYVLQDGERGLWASCDVREEKRQECYQMMKKFMPLMLGTDTRYNFSSTIDYKITTTSNKEQPPVTDLVCARTAVAGIGSLTDHGTIKSHGWEEEDYNMMHNHGRGGLLYEFRNFMVDNLGLLSSSHNNNNPLYGRRQHRIVFSQRSSDIYIRSMDFERQIELVQQSFPNEKVENYTLKTLSLHDQVAIASQTSIFVTLCGGGAVTAMFLPKGASAIIYYGEDSGTKDNKLTGKPALLDWDLFNSMSHLRVHWMPRNSRAKTVDESALILLIQHELSIIESRAFD